jgi:hypothetical protein
MSMSNFVRTVLAGILVLLVGFQQVEAAGSFSGGARANGQLYLKKKHLTIRNDSGGYVVRYAMKMMKLKASGTNVRFAGRCDSACTLYLALPRSQTCVAPGATFRFHAPSATSTHAVKVAQSYMMKKYPGWVRSWIRSRGGLSRTLITMDYSYARSFIKTCESASLVRRPLNSRS